MDSPVIFYLHGFCSSPSSWKAKLLADRMTALGQGERFRCPQLSPIPDEAITTSEAIIREARGQVILVGSSLGGHYATFLAERYDLQAVLINPAVVPGIDLGLFLGEHANFHSGEKFIFTPEHACQLQRQVVAQPTGSRYLLMVETGDEVLDYRHAIEHYAGCRQLVLPGGNHSFTNFPQYIPQILEFAGL